MNKKLVVGILGGIGLAISIILTLYLFGEMAALVSVLPFCIIWAVIMGFFYPIAI
jgi:hypothetical protein